MNNIEEAKVMDEQRMKEVDESWEAHDREVAEKVAMTEVRRGVIEAVAGIWGEQASLRFKGGTTVKFSGWSVFPLDALFGNVIDHEAKWGQCPIKNYGGNGGHVGQDVFYTLDSDGVLNGLISVTDERKAFASGGGSCCGEDGECNPYSDLEAMERTEVIFAALKKAFNEAKGEMPS